MATVTLRAGLACCAMQHRCLASVSSARRLQLPTGEWLRAEAGRGDGAGASGSSSDEVIVRVGVSDANLVRSSASTRRARREEWCQPDMYPVAGPLARISQQLNSPCLLQDAVGDIRSVHVLAAVGSATAPGGTLLRLHWEGFLVRAPPATGVPHYPEVRSTGELTGTVGGWSV
jgi:hypothetical protein